MLNLPLEMLKPYTWLRVLGKSSLGFLVSPIVVKYNLINNGLPLPLFKSKKTYGKLLDDINKYSDRSKHVNFNNISQLLILLFLWIFAGAAFQKYNKMIIYERN